MVDSDGLPIVGATVAVKGVPGKGTVTDIDGRFSISGIPANETLVVSYVGMVSQEIALHGVQEHRIVLLDDTELLDELVVVGYGTMRKSDLTGSVSSAKGEDLLKQQSFSPLDALKGKVAGVNIFANTGQPGGGMRVLIRGLSTINASANPLYIVDGVAMENFELLNPNDIESIEVLKDASSAAIYGARGANGVVMVTTKRGSKNGTSNISYAGSISIGTMQREMDVMNSKQWMAAFKQGLENANAWQGKNFDTDLSKIFTDRRLFNADGSPIYDTNWQRESTRTAVSHNHQVNIQRSGDDYSMGAFLNYTDQQGILHNSYMKRINAKLAYDDKPLDWLSTSNNLLINYSWGNRIPDNPYHQGAIRTMIEQLPFLPVMMDGVYAQSNIVQTEAILNDKNDPNSGKQGFAPEGVGNPVELLKRLQNRSYNTQLFGNSALTFHLMDGLDLRTQLGVDYHVHQNEGYTPFTPRPLTNHSSQGSASGSTVSSIYWQEETYLTYVQDFGEHHLNAMAGMSWQARTWKSLSANNANFVDDALGYYNLGSGVDRPGVGSSHDKWTMNSYFLRVAYSYANKYMATLTGRYDGSSRFGSNNKYAFFPSLGLGWTVSEEDFMKDASFIDRLKLHTSYGVTGNTEIGTYRSLATLGQATVLIGDEMKKLAYRTNLPNPNLKWERTSQFDIGMELSVLQSRLNFDVSYYYKYTSDLLLNRPIARSSGFSSIMDNVGAVSNRGVDILVTAYPVQTKDFTWTSTLNLGYNRNRVEKLDENASVDPLTGKRQITTDGFVGYDMLIREGEQLSSFYGPKRVGIYDGKPENWDPETMNIPGVIGEKVTYKDRQIIGNGLPDWMGSFINTFKYKNLDLTMDFQFSWGVQLMQEYYHSTVARFLTNGLTRLYEEAWHPTLNPNGKEQAIRLNNFGQGANNGADDDWVCDGSYLRLNLVQLGYTLDPQLTKKIGLSSMRVYANVNNAFLLTSKDYLGYDPDNSTRLGDNKWGASRQFFSYPRPRTFTLGLNITF